LGLFIFFLAFALFFGRFSLSAPYIGDDLHLIRVYSADELRSVWTSTWDPDGIETPGLRPLTIYFYHALALVFGPSPAMQRGFLLGLFALLLTLANIVAQRLFGADHRPYLLGGLLALFHVANVPHYSWITDGVYLAAGVFVFGAIGSLLCFLRSTNPYWLIVSSLGVILALLVREDSLVVYPLLVLFGATFYLGDHLELRPSPKRLRIPLFMYSVGLITFLLVWWYWRKLAIPEAISLRMNWRGWLWSVEQAFLPVGDATRLVLYWNRWLTVIELWKLCLGALAVIWLFLVDRKTQVRVGFWLTAAILAALPGLTLARINLLLLPTIFAGFAIATLLFSFSKRSALAYLCAISIAFFALGASAAGSYLIQRERVPTNIDYLCGAPEWLYGKFAHATIPSERREEIKRHLEAVGIYSLADRDRVIPVLVAEARENGRYSPRSSGLFVPKFRFLISPEWRLWSCVGREGWLFQ
jgi:hypothetical protein